MEDMESLDVLSVLRDGVMFAVYTVSLIAFTLLGVSGLKALL